MAPNEEDPIDEVPFLEKAGAGIHVSLGTERGFMGAALNPNATHLLLIDRDPDVVRFNQINIALLRMAANRQEYLALRQAPAYSAWKEAMDKAARASPGIIRREDRRILSEQAFQFWNRKILSEGFSVFQAPPSRPGDAFWGANYLHEDRLYDRISTLAREGRIRAVQIDLSDRPRLAFITGELAREHLQVGVLDISNAWWPHYMGSGLSVARRTFIGFLEGFQERAAPSSLLLMTDTTNGLNMAWRYFSAPLRREGHEEAQALYRQLLSIRGQVGLINVPGLAFSGADIGLNAGGAASKTGFSDEPRTEPSSGSRLSCFLARLRLAL